MEECRRPRVEEILARLREKGYKTTYTRIEVIRAIVELGEKHPSLTEVYERVKKRVPTMSSTTVYNTVKLLESLGIIVLFDHNGDKHVDLVTRPHINLVYPGGEIRDFCDPEALEKLEELAGIIEEKLGEKPANILVSARMEKGPGEG